MVTGQTPAGAPRQRRRRGRLGRGGRGKGRDGIRGTALAQTPPLRSLPFRAYPPRSPHRPGPHRAPEVRAAAAAAPRRALGPGSRAEFAGSAVAAQTAAPAAAATAMARALGPTSLPPAPPLYSPPLSWGDVTATRGEGGTRRGRLGSPALGTLMPAARSRRPWSPSPRGDHGLRPRPSTVAQTT